MHKLIKIGKQLCEAIIGRDPNSHQPKLIRCNNKAELLYYHNDNGKLRHGFPMCKECFDKMEK